MPTDFPRCETCRFWNFDLGSEPCGICLAADELDFIGDMTRSIVGQHDCIVETKLFSVVGKAADHYDAAMLVTRSDFGCIAHEPREG